MLSLLCSTFSESQCKNRIAKSKGLENILM